MNICQVWIGRFGANAPEKYFVQEFDEDGEALACQFAADQGEKWFDHDSVEISWADDGMKDVRSFINGHSYSEAYIDQVVTKASELGIEQINVFVLADKGEFPNPRSVVGQDFHLWYCGEFNCEHEREKPRGKE